MARWYRAYDGTTRDDKLHEAALIADTSRSVVIACWHSILESAALCNDAGRFETTARRVAATLCERCETVERVFAAFSELKMIGDNGVLAWSRRQFESDNSSERSRRHRETKRNANATLQQRDATPPYTDTDTDTESKVVIAPAPMRDYVLEMTQAAGEAVDDTSPATHMPSEVLAWLQAGCDFDYDVLPAIKANCANRKPRSVRSWAYFTQIVSDARERRVSGLPPANLEQFSTRSRPNDNPLTAALERNSAKLARIGRKTDFTARHSAGSGNLAEI